MPTINKAFKEISCKIVYYGPGLCGKTTNLQIIHKQIPSKNRGELVSLATEQDRTLFFDFLPLDLGDVKGFKTKFQLYTVPGQVFYNATRKLVLRGVDGVIFVADSHADRLEDNVASFENLKENLEEYNLDIEELPVVLQYNKRDLPNVLSIDELERSLNPRKKYQFVEAVAYEGKGVKETLKSVSSLVLAKINESVAGGGERKASRLAEVARQRQEQQAPAAASAAPIGGGLGAAPSIGGGSPLGAPPRPSAAPASAAPVLGAGAPPVSVPPPPDSTSALRATQEGKALWRGIRVGATRLELTGRNNSDGKGAYQLSGMVKGLLSKKFWSKIMEKAEPAAESRPGRPGILYFRESPASRDKNKPVEVWVDEANPSMLFAREIDGSREFSPAGERLKDFLS